jgi:hypothetical protein
MTYEAKLAQITDGRTLWVFFIEHVAKLLCSLVRTQEKSRVLRNFVAHL